MSWGTFFFRTNTAASTRNDKWVLPDKFPTQTLVEWHMLIYRQRLDGLLVAEPTESKQWRSNKSKQQKCKEGTTTQENARAEHIQQQSFITVQQSTEVKGACW